MRRRSQKMANLSIRGYDGHIRYWRLSDKTFLRSIIGNGWGVNVMYVDETDGLIAYGTTDGAMVIHDLGTDKELVRMGDERVPVLSVAISPDKSQIGFGNAKGMVKIIDMASMSLLRDFKAANGPIWSLLLMPQAGDMVVASLDDHISKWQIQDFPLKYWIVREACADFIQLLEINNGKRQFARKCSVCHTLEADGRRRAGPTLFGVFVGALEACLIIPIHKPCLIQILSGQQNQLPDYLRMAPML